LQAYFVKFPFLENVFYLLVLIIISAVSFLIAYKILIPVIRKIAAHTKTSLDDHLFNHRVPQQLMLLIPAIVFYYGASFFSNFKEQIERIAFAYIVVNIAIVIIKLLKAFNDYYNSLAIAKKRSLTGFCEAIQIVVIIIAAIVSISSLLDKSPAVFLSSLGAIAAILTLAFRETIISIVSGILIQMNDMFRVGDWIEMPKYGVDGDLIELGLHTAKIRNWDKTVSTIPTNKLVDDAVKNWRGMTETGGRRIKRSILIDQTSIKFCSKELLEKLKTIELLKDSLIQKEESILEHNKDKDTTNVVNGRCLTNVGLFRAYVVLYLKNHSLISPDLTLLVRQLQPDSEKGLPIQIYCFTTDIRWRYYEDIQSDIFDHIYAILHIFELKPFQRTSSYNPLVELSDKN